MKTILSLKSTRLTMKQSGKVQHYSRLRALDMVNMSMTIINLHHTTSNTASNKRVIITAKCKKAIVNQITLKSHDFKYSNKIYERYFLYFLVFYIAVLILLIQTEFKSKTII
jgi:hypothetical protein